jgi:hypothetical protein
MYALDLDDPRTWPTANAAIAPYVDAQRAIDATTRADADALDARLRDWVTRALAAGEGELLARTVAQAPSPATARHLRRVLTDVERAPLRASGELYTTLFAIPVIVVAGLDAEAVPVTLDAVLSDVAPLAAMLRDARAFGGCETFALSSSLVAADRLDIAALPLLLARRALVAHAGDFAGGALDLPPSPIPVDSGVERVHLRFIPGVLLTPPGIDPLAESTIGRWGMALAAAIAKALTAPGVTRLALPRPAQRPVAAVQSGRAAQREVSAQIFASNAIRRIRASHGEPTAIVSAHRATDAPGGGELRLSLSSPFAAKAAEGFRCPLYPYETVQEVAAMLVALLRDCRVSAPRFMAGVHGDVDPVTGGPLFFKDHGASPAAPLH